VLQAITMVISRCEVPCAGGRPAYVCAVSVEHTTITSGGAASGCSAFRRVGEVLMSSNTGQRDSQGKSGEKGQQKSKDETGKQAKSQQDQKRGQDQKKR
jgi:hypothetical protein